MKTTDSSLVIIDTSALIEANQNPNSLIGKYVSGLIGSGLAAITPLIRWEMGRGKISAKERAKLLEYLDSLELADWKIIWEDLEEFDLTVRKLGYIVPLSDLWIARTAIAQKSFLLHKDKHFIHIASCSTLRIWNPS